MKAVPDKGTAFFVAAREPRSSRQAFPLVLGQRIDIEAGLALSTYAKADALWKNSTKGREKRASGDAYIKRLPQNRETPLGAGDSDDAGARETQNYQTPGRAQAFGARPEKTILRQKGQARRALLSLKRSLERVAVDERARDALARGAEAGCVVGLHDGKP